MNVTRSQVFFAIYSFRKCFYTIGVSIGGKIRLKLSLFET